MTTVANEVSTLTAALHEEPASSLLRVCILLDGDRVPAWVAAVLVNLRTSLPAVPKIFLPTPHSGGEPAAPRAPLLFRMWYRLDRFLGSSGADAFAETDVRSLLSGMTVLRITGGDSADQAKLLELVNVNKFDVLVDLGLKKRLGSAADGIRFGVWRFQGTNESGSRHDYTLFWQLYRGSTVSHTQLLARMPDQRRSSVLYDSCFATDPVSLYRMENRECWRRGQILAQCLTAAPRGEVLHSELSSQEAMTDSDRVPTTAEMTRFAARWAVRRILRAAQRLFFREHWFLGLRRRPSASMPTQLSRFQIIQSPGRFNYADPFLFEKDGGSYLFFEKWRKNGGGVLCCVKLNADGRHGEPKVILARNYHLSYPQVFENQGGIYLLPESRENNRIELYQAEEFPWRWKLAHVLIENVAAADPTLLHYNGMFWLFASGAGTRSDLNSELFLYFSESLSGPWQAHPLNPVVSDVRRARPAGRLFLDDDGQLIRPGQDSSKVYGHRVRLNRVDVLSRTEYRETPLNSIGPEWFDGNLGTHTLNRTKQWEVLDGRVLVPRLSLRAPTRAVRPSGQVPSLLPRWSKLHDQR